MPQLKDLPSVDTLLGSQPLRELIHSFGVHAVRDAIRTVQQGIRAKGHMPDWADTPQGYVPSLREHLRPGNYTPVFNLTGTVIHTNLGRALIDADIWNSVQPLVNV